jgi:hypothetical protein
MGAQAGLPWVLNAEFYSYSTGMLANAAAAQIDITYQGLAGSVSDVPGGGPFYFTGATSSTPGQIWTTGTGLYSFAWAIPLSAPSGAYVANWTFTFGGKTWEGTENFWVSGGNPVPVPPGDTGYWTGSISYVPPATNLAQLTSVSIPLGAVDGNGIAWLINKLEGWDGPDVQGGGVIPKSGDHGAVSAPQYYAARQLTLTLTAMAATQAQRDVARGLLQEAIPVSDLATLTYNEPVPKQVQVRRSGKVTETYTDLCAVQFTVGLVAPDPRKYGTTLMDTGAINASPTTGIGIVFPVTFPITFPAQPPGGSVLITNAGTFETRPVITITGPVTGPSLVNATTGQTVSWSQLSLGATDVLVADFNARQAQLNGVYRPADLGSSWWVLPPGVACTVELGGGLGTGASIAAQWAPAWI